MSFSLFRAPTVSRDMPSLARRPPAPVAYLGRALSAIALAAGAVHSSLVAQASAAPATEHLKQMSLEDLMAVKVVTATQVATDAFDLPFLVATRTRADYERTLPRSFAMWLDGVPGVMIQKTANGHMSPYIRGFTGFRTLLLIDGIRLNNSFFREGPNQYASSIDPLAFGRVELVKGPASVLYGSDSIGGTINAISADLLGNGRPAWERSASYRAATGEASHTARAEVSGPLGDKAALRLGGTRKWLGDLRGGPDVGRQRGTGYDESGYDARFELQLRPGLRVAVAHQNFDQEGVERTHSTPLGPRWRGLSTGTDRERSSALHRSLTYAQLRGHSPGGIVDELTFTLSQHNQHENQRRIRSDGRRDDSTAEVDTSGAALQLQRASPLGQWVFGANYYHDKVDTATGRYLANGNFDRWDVQGLVADDSTYDLAGAFVENQLPAWGPFHFTMCGRYDTASARAGRILDPTTNLPTSFAGDWDAIVGSVRFTYAPPPASGRKWLAFAGVSDGYRAPNLSDLSRLDTSGSSQIETPSTAVRPESYRIYEVGVKFRGQRWDLTAAVFHTAIDDLIIRRPTGRILRGLAEVTKLSAGRGYVRGLEFEGRYAVSDNLMLKSAFTAMRGEVDVFPTNDPTQRTTETLSRLMPTTTRLALDWTLAPRQLWFEVACAVAARQTRLSSSDALDRERIPPGGTPGYTVWNVHAHWRPLPRLTLSATIENATNRDYRIHGSGLNEPGRNLIVGGTLAF